MTGNDLTELTATMASVETKVDGLDAKVTDFIDVQRKTNDLVETRVGKVEVEQATQIERVSNLRNTFLGIQGLMTMTYAGAVAWVRSKTGG